MLFLAFYEFYMCERKTIEVVELSTDFLKWPSHLFSLLAKIVAQNVFSSGGNNDINILLAK